MEIRIRVDHYIHAHGEDSDLLKIVRENLHITKNIMATIAELNAKADLLQQTIDETQAAAIEKITTLETTVQELKDIIAAGGDPAQLQEVADKLDSATADLKSTFPAPQP